MSILILDTESTGLNEPQVNELGYVKVDSLETLEVLDTFEQRYKPDKPSELGALMTHNILDSELVDCSSYLTASLPIETTYVIGHNIDYDMGVLNLTNADIKRICTKALASYFLPELDSHRQSALLYYFEGD
ncbi:MAG: 3'-5' exonuclease, partial [Epsilonproteobacteria bacterium]